MKNTICDLYLMPVVLNLFDGNTNTTLDPGLSDEICTSGRRSSGPVS